MSENENPANVESLKREAEEAGRSGDWEKAAGLYRQALQAAARQHEKKMGEQADLQSALYRIASAASEVKDLQEFYAQVHAIVGELMTAPNFIVQLYDEASQMVSYPYVEDASGEISTVPPVPFSKIRKGLAIKVLQTGKALHVPAEKWEEMVASGEIDRLGSASEDWMGVPLHTEGRTIGVIAVSRDDPSGRYSEADVRLLEFVAQHIATALVRARALEAERQRSDELQLVNTISEGLLARMDLDGIMDVAARQIQARFETENIIIAFYEKPAGVIRAYIPRFEGGRLEPVELPYGEGLTSLVIQGNAPVKFDTLAEALEQPYRLPNEYEEMPFEGLSWIGVPLRREDEAIGALIVADARDRVYNQGHVRLLSTIAANLGVALENARLFDETQRLLQETEERNSELAIINSIQHGLAAKLEMRAIIDLVGRKVGEIFNALFVYIALYDREADQIEYPFVFDFQKGQSFPQGPQTLDAGASAHMIRSKQPLMINEDFDQQMALLGSRPFAGADFEAQALLGAPLMAGDEAMGTVVLIRRQTEGAFSTTDLRLLQTLGSAMSVALENARLFDETQRLLKETETRNAELAVINSVQRGLASQLDFHAIVRLVGDNVKEIFNADTAYIQIVDATRLRINLAYFTEGERKVSLDGAQMAFINHSEEQEQQPAKDEDFVLESGLSYHIVKTGESLRLGTVEEALALDSHAIPSPGGQEDLNQSYLGVPILAGEQVMGVLSAQSYRRHAYSESDLRLLQTLANAMSVALENARLFDETQRLLQETEQRAAELAIINSVQEGLASKLEMGAIYTLVGDKMREIFEADTAFIFSFDPDQQAVYAHYYVDRDRPQAAGPVPYGQGIYTQVIESRRPVLYGTQQAWLKAGGVVIDPTGEGEQNESVLMVPIMLGNRVTGVVSVQSYRQHAYGESDTRLLATLANALSVALENARLFDETQRLVEAEQQRVAELQIINSIQQGLAAELDFQAIVDLVGDKLRAEFETPDLSIRWYDEKADLLHHFYLYEHGERLELPPSTPVAGGPFEAMRATRQPIVLNTPEDYASLELSPLPGTDLGKSMISAPIITGDRVIGSITIEHYEREHAYDESELRLLTTVAASLGTALENARLFDETQRLLKETEDRNAELAIINSVQEALAAELDIQGI